MVGDTFVNVGIIETNVKLWFLWITIALFFTISIFFWQLDIHDMMISSMDW